MGSGPNRRGLLESIPIREWCSCNRGFCGSHQGSRAGKVLRRWPKLRKGPESWKSCTDELDFCSKRQFLLRFRCESSQGHIPSRSGERMSQSWRSDLGAAKLWGSFWESTMCWELFCIKSTRMSNATPPLLSLLSQRLLLQRTRTTKDYIGWVTWMRTRDTIIGAHGRNRQLSLVCQLSLPRGKGI